MMMMTIIGRHCIGRMNENGQRLLELCCHRRLCVTNTYFKCKEPYKVSWRHPRSKHWHQLDLVITRRANLKSVPHTRSFHSADCDTDHTLVASKVRLTPKIHCTKTNGAPRINTCCAKDPAKALLFCNTFRERMDASTTTDCDVDSRWCTLCDAIHSLAITSFGKKERHNADWFEAH